MKKTYKVILVAIVLIILLGVLAKVFNLEDKILKKIYPKTYEEYVEKYAKEYNVDPLLVFSMQIMDSTAVEIANKIDEPIVDETLFDPEKNIMIGTKYYSELLKLYNGNMLLALTAYNAGIGNVKEWIDNGIIKADGSDIENIPYKETNMYVRKIIRNYKIYQKLEEKN